MDEQVLAGGRTVGAVRVADAHDAVWFVGQAWRPGLVIGHHDAAPFNAAWRGGNLVGFIDWDSAGPASREMDLAYVALSWVPLYPVDVAMDLGYPESDERAGRLQVLLDAYGYDGDRVALGATIAQRAQINADVIRGRPPAATSPIKHCCLSPRPWSSPRGMWRPCPTPSGADSKSNRAPVGSMDWTLVPFRHGSHSPSEGRFGKTATAPVRGRIASRP